MPAVTSDATQAVLSPEAWSDPSRIDSAFAHFRGEAPVAWIDEPGYRPFWLITRHADIAMVERDAERFTTQPRPSLQPIEMERLGLGRTLSTLSHKDGEDHRVHRAVAADWFKPRNMQSVRSDIAVLARNAIDGLASQSGDVDFAADIALRYPLQAILSIFGLPLEDTDLLLRLTQELFTYSDLELARDRDPSLSLQAVQEFQAYFHRLGAERRQNPDDGLASLIANALINGRPMSDFDLMSYYVSLAAGGVYSTGLALSGGLQALLDNPDQLELLRREPDRISDAVEEIIRWTTPIRHMMRTAQEDTEIRGTRITAGEAVLLSYVSANRDEDIFEDVRRFRVTRTPNRQIAFGLGVHYCLGAPLARLELQVFLTELLSRLESIELAGPVRWTESTLVGGVKHLPIRCSIRA